MPKIKKITRLNHPGVLRDFRWPTNGLSPFADYNLIYGPNGSGKTTISSIFRNLEKRQSPHLNVKAELNMGGHRVSGDDFPNQSNLSIRVFNREFISENVSSASREKGMPLILFLGEESTEKQNELEDLRNQKSRVNTELGLAANDLKRVSRKLDQHSIERAKIIKDKLLRYESAQFRNYDKRNYLSAAEQMVCDENAEGQILDPSETVRLYNLLEENLKTIIPEVTKPDYSNSSILKQAKNILDKTVMSSALRSLEKDNELSKWVGIGMSMYKKRNSKACLFCEQPIPKERLEKLEGRFSDEYDQFVREIRKLITQLEGNKKEIDKIRLPQKSDFYDEFIHDFDLARTAYRTSRQELNNFLDKLIQKLEGKETQPFRKTKLEIEAPDSLNCATESLNEIITNHNYAHGNFQARKTEAITRLESSLILETHDELQSLVTEKTRLEIEAGNLKTKLEDLTTAIDQLEKTIIEFRTPAEELNTELHRYLGHDELRLEAKETGYCLMRKQGVAGDISEGEKTALALLYFLKTLKHKEFKLEEGIVVLDDPVSSLDSNALYLAFGYIKERTKSVGQLFVLTHNFAFFRQVKNWFNYAKRRGCRSVQFYMLEKINQNGPRQTKLNKLDPLLRDYENEYHYLFAQVYRRINEPQEVSMGYDYGLANAARRLLEIFFAFQRPGTPVTFYRRITSSHFDGAKLNRILRFTNTYSHSNSTGEAGHDESVLLETKPILEDILMLIKSENEEHYSRMIQNVR